jgi:metallophosphoesterase (TIGR00282 family)
MVRILFLGDIVASLGRQIVHDLLPELKEEYSIDFTIANGENATHGKGLSLAHYRELVEDGVDCVTMGNHYMRVQEILDKNVEYGKMIRPANFNPSIPGRGSLIFEHSGIKIRVTNLIGRVGIDGADSNPFDCLDKILNDGEKVNIDFVDFHAEATGEKLALANAFDGRISCMVGTHTHVQTNDARILPLGTGCICDAGMCGGYNTILGDDPEPIIRRTWHGLPAKFTCPKKGRAFLNGVVFSVNERTGKTEKIEPVQKFEDYSE